MPNYTMRSRFLPTTTPTLQQLLIPGRQEYKNKSIQEYEITKIQQRKNTKKKQEYKNTEIQIAK